MKSIFFLLLLLIIPLGNSLTLTEITLNNSIYINESISLNRLIVNSTQVALFNLTSEGNLTNIANETQTIYFYDLTDPFNDLFWDNNTLIQINAINKSIDIPAGRRIIVKIKDETPPTITIINPVVGLDENTLPVNFMIYTDKEATCDINIDNSTNISMTTSNNLNFTYSKNLDNGLYEAVFYCNDTSNNLGTNSIEFYVAKSGTGTGDAIYIIPPEKIFLENISIRYDIWYKNEKNAIYVYSYDKDGNLRDLTNLSINSIPEYQKEIVRIGEGAYKGLFTVGNESDVVLNIIAEDKDKKIEQEVVIELKSRSPLENIKDNLQITGKKISRLFESKGFWISILIITILIILYLVLDKRKKQ